MNHALADLFPTHLQALQNRAGAALAAAGFDSLVLHSGRPPDVFLDDIHYPFKAHAPFKAWLPLTDAPDCLLAFTPGRRPKLAFYSPDDYWHKPPSPPSGYWTDCFEIEIVGSPAAARAALGQQLGRTAFIGDHFPELHSFGFSAINPEHLMARLDFDRAAKSPYEIECLREANRIGMRGHAAAEAVFRARGSEFAVELAFMAACGQREQELPYNPIIALNEHAAVLHYQVLETQPPARHRSLLIDAGASFAGFASDITRTYSFEDTDFRDLILAMDQLQLGLCAEVRAGVDWADIQRMAYRRIGALLCEADVLRSSVDEAVESGVVSAFFPHGIGHLLGLQVHDVGGRQRSHEGGEIPRPEGHPYLRLTRVLQEGFVVTMEPGLYFIDSLLTSARSNGLGRQINWTRVEALAPFGGIRIEDNLAVTRGGCANLTRAAPGG